MQAEQQQAARAEWWKYFVDAMGVMRASYPNAHIPDDQWKGMLKVWAKKLQSYPAKVIGQATWTAAKQFPERFPTLGQFEAHVAGTAKSYTREGRPLPKQHLTLIGTEAHVLGTDNPFEQLARMWEGEIQHAKIDPERPPPPEMHAQWMKDFWRVWDKNGPGSTQDRFVKGEDGKWQRVVAQ